MSNMSKYLIILKSIFFLFFISCNETVKKEDRIEQAFHFNTIYYFDFDKIKANYKSERSTVDDTDFNYVDGDIIIGKEAIKITFEFDKKPSKLYKIEKVTLDKTKNTYTYTYNTNKFDVEVRTNKMDVIENVEVKTSLKTNSSYMYSKSK